MTIPAPDIAAVIQAYDVGGMSFVDVAYKLKISVTSVHNIMRQHAPGLIRPNINKPLHGGLTLAALGLYDIDPCTACGTSLVSYTPEKGQACGFCRVTGLPSLIFQQRTA